MLTDGTAVDYLDLALLTAFDLVSIVIFTVGIYFRRHRRKDLVLVFAFFNICLFIVVRVIQMTEVAAALGFGLFAILSIIRLRSEPFNNREIGYFFGALVLGLVNGIGTPHLGLTVATNLLVLAAVFVLDHPQVLQGGAHQHIVLDIVHTDPVLLRSVLEQRLGAEVDDFVVHSIDFVRDSMDVEVRYRYGVDGPSPSLLSTAAAWVRS